MSTTGPVPKHCLGFSFIRSYYHELDVNFDERELKSKSYHISNIRVQLFCKNIVVIQEEWFADINLTVAANFSDGPDQMCKIQNQQNNLFST